MIMLTLLQPSFHLASRLVESWQSQPDPDKSRDTPLHLYPRSYRFSLVQKKKKKLHKEAGVEGEKMKREEGNEGGGNKVCQNSVAFQLLFFSAFLPR